MRVGTARASSSGTRPIGSAASAGAEEATRVVVGAPDCATLPHAWHSPHRPTQRGAVQPHSEQR